MPGHRRPAAAGASSFRDHTHNGSSSRSERGDPEADRSRTARERDPPSGRPGCSSSRYFLHSRVAAMRRSFPRQVNRFRGPDTGPQQHPGDKPKQHSEGDRSHQRHQPLPRHDSPPRTPPPDCGPGGPIPPDPPVAPEPRPAYRAGREPDAFICRVPIRMGPSRRFPSTTTLPLNSFSLRQHKRRLPFKTQPIPVTPGSE